MAETLADIAILGGGASGAVTAANLMRKGFLGGLAIVSRESAVGQGIAYGTREMCHLLNVRASNMSAFADTPTDFVDWLTASGCEVEGLAQTFQPRAVYGRYVRDRLEQAIHTSACRFTPIHGEAVGISRGEDGIRIELANGDSIVAKKVVLALGNLAPYTPRECQGLLGSDGWVPIPWAAGALDRVEETDDVLILGTGLTMVDLVLSLRSQGHRGRIYARSRHGLMPQRHAPAGASPVEPPKTVKELIDGCREAGQGWRAVIDSIRASTPHLWGELSWKERQRLLWRLMPYWNVARHRMPPEVADAIEGLVERGTLDLGAGTVISATETNGWIWVQFNSGPVRVKHFINATGPSCNWKQAKVPLVESAVLNGLAELDPLGQGVLVDEEGRTDPTGEILAIGPICRGCRLETTAMPEIRVQADRAAELLLA